MTAEGFARRLAAILAADVAGYSRLIGLNEEGTLARLHAVRAEILDPTIAGHRGRIVKTTGDGLLAEFASVVDAVRSAIEIQNLMGQRNADAKTDERIDFRIGINVGDIVERDGDIFGDGVNIAARLEGIADPGGVCVSKRVQEDATGKSGATFEDLGEQRLKNIDRTVHVYRACADDASPVRRSAHQQPGLPEKPSIAVLAFQNMSGDAEQDYFADGIVEEIITALSRMRWLFVIARNSTFTYKGRAVDVKQIGRELGVRYLLEGSVRKAGQRVRITGQLIDAVTGAHLWADRFDGGLEDIFDLQDQVTERVIGAIAPKLEQAEINRSRGKRTESLDAYDYYLRGIASAHKLTSETNDEALRLFAKAIELDAEFASAYGMAAWCFVMRKANGWMTDRKEERAETERLARRAVDLGSDDAVALSRGGHALGFVVGDLESGALFIDRAIALNPNLAAAWLFSGWVRANLGEPETALLHLETAIRMSPLDPLMFGMQNGIAFAHFLAGRYAEAVLWSEKSLREKPDYLPSLRFAAASYALDGRMDQAISTMARIRRLDPKLRLSNLAEVVPIRRPPDMARLIEGLRLAGLPA